MRSVLLAGALAAVLAGCGNRRAENREVPHDARQIRRVIEPSPDRVGPLPPYAIRADGVGPYKLGEKLSELLEQLVSGPRIELFEIAGVVHRNVIRAEDDTILVGGEQASTASFVAVVGGEVARTESGIHVGSTRDEVVAALGTRSDDPDRARDPRVLVPRALANVRIVIDDGRAAAIVVASAAAPAATPARRAYECDRPAANGRAIGACLTSTGELLEAGTDEVVIKSADGERTLATLTKVAGLVFAAPLRSAVDGRDELVVITRTDDPALRSWWIAAYRLDGTRLTRTIDPTQLYQLSSANARWIGADLHEVELYLELASRSDGIDVGGLLTTPSAPRAATKIRDVVVISAASVVRHRSKTGATEGSAGASAPASPAPVGNAPSRTPVENAAAGRGQASAVDAAVDASDPAHAEPESKQP